VPLLELSGDSFFLENSLTLQPINHLSKSATIVHKDQYKADIVDDGALLVP
jgi:hypothetical protein